jgi:copper chaperone NosL
MTRRRILSIAVAGAAGTGLAPALWAIFSRPPAEAGPPSIRYGHDRCDACGMLIGDPRYAAGVRLGNGVRRYDDIGCLVRHSGPVLASKRASGYVHDADTPEWLSADSAIFIRSADIRTPMGFGIAAYASAAAAQRAAGGAPPMPLAALLLSLAGDPS